MSTLAAGSVAPPLDERRIAEVRDAVAGLTSAELAWVSGYVAGLAAGPAPAEPAAAPDNTLTILYGSQTGNGQAIAEALAERGRDAGFAASLVNLADYKPSSLKRETLVCLVISTHGDGDPPDDAELFHEFIMSKKAPQLPNLRYLVLALGDSSYTNFCQTGREVDARLADLGAERLETLVECDLDYEDAAAAWSNHIVEKLPELLRPHAAAPRLRAVKSVAQYDKKRPFAAEVLVNQRITGAGSSKDVRHIELSLEGSGLRYEPGDSLAVVAENPPALVEQFFEVLGIAGGEPVTISGQTVSVGEALREKLEITSTNLGFIKAWATLSGAVEVRELLEPGRGDTLAAFIQTHQVIDVIRRYPAEVSVHEFANSLRKLKPRSYSIASSLNANPDEVHLTVAAVRYQAFGSEHWGAASTHLADRVTEGQTVPVFVESNPRFRLPADDTRIIMVGPGTGIAPFRAFVEERAERGAMGRNWLFFGDRNFQSDFLYQLEWHRHRKRGNLHRLDVAFSRDQRNKIYVQHRLLENGKDVYRWLDDGAVIYVCGDAKRMAPDVHDALVRIVATHGGLSHDDAENHLKELRRAGRYQRDVY